jgi:hypothetical protein
MHKLNESGKRSRFINILLAVQGAYSLITALWGLVDIESFMDVTGPKTDVWLVKAVSVLIVPLALCLLSVIYINNSIVTAAILGITSAIGLGFIDFYYSLKNVISDVYLADGFMQVFFLIGWLFAIRLIRTGSAEN